ncbi:glycosyltransferase family 4 protein [Pseudonocardia bannensis]|uniref:Glycosyltransferase family 4 protein n=2 Tax=Pseudonocardia bannensis TaxID=630973 RepID=A0A848DHA0_9PSEU|nr:glycosyltransferase family 4 protein [Pseudonocardia bannensis]
MSERFLAKNVGGNSTYARYLARGLRDSGVEVGHIRTGSSPLTTILWETIDGLRKAPADSVLHYIADTGPLFRVRAPSVVTVHGVASRWIRTARNSAQELAWRGRVRRAIDSTDAVITVSSSSADDISEVFSVPRDRISVIPHGIDLASMSRSEDISGSLAGILPKNFALYVGNIEPRKNLRALVGAFEATALRDLGVPLVIAGKPAWNYAETLRDIEAAENVIYVGFVSDADRAALMHRCQLFVFPSLYEGFGFPVLEAMAAGAPVICSNRGSLRDLAGPAMLFESVDVEGIASGVLNALIDDDWRDKCRREGPLWSQRFDWSESVNAHLDVYTRLLD